MALIEKLGFTTPRTIFGELEAVVAAWRDYAGGARERADYDIDGLVVSANDLRTLALLGELGNRPRGAVAFKFPHDERVTTLIGIEWNTGDTGRITPVAFVEPVVLAGAKVQRASLHNAANVRKLTIGVGDQVLVSRRNDVIPYVEKVVVPAGHTATPPTRCGSCGNDIVLEGEYLVCRNDDCPARRIGRLKIWVRTLGLRDWGEKTLERFFAKGLVKEPAELYRLSVDDIAKLEGFGIDSAKKLVDPLHAKKEIPIATFIAALGIESVSVETARLLVASGYGDIEALANATIEKLCTVDGIEATKATKIVTGIRARLDEIARLRSVGVVAVASSEGGPLAGSASASPAAIAARETSFTRSSRRTVDVR